MLGTRVGSFASYDRASIALALVASTILTLTLTQYGLTYDEPNHVRYGDHVLSYYASGFADERALTFARYYNGGFDLFAALLRRALPLSPFAATHAACLSVALLGLLGTWRLARTVAGPSAGFWALLFLLLTPVYYGHQLNNMKDLPFAAGYVWGVGALIRWGQNLPRPSLRATAFLGIAAGAASCVRIAGLVLFSYGACLVAWHLAARAFRKQPSLRPLLGLCPHLLLASAIAWSVLVLTWPWALQAPFSRPLEALSRFSNYKAFTSGTLLHGVEYPAQDVPWHYIPTYFGIQLPEALLLVLGLTLIFWCLWGLREWRRAPDALPPYLVLLLAAFFPPIYAIAKGSTVYDGLRHYLFLIPILCAMAGIGFTQFVAWLRARRPRFGHIAAAAVVAGCLPVVASMTRLHPYQHLYFNSVVGGLPGAIGRYETEYYGSVYRELNQWLAEYAWQRDGDEFLARDYRVTGCGTNWFFNAYLPRNMRFIARRNARRADFFSTYRRYGCHEHHSGRKIIHRVTREGATLAVVRDMKQRRGKRKRPRHSPSKHPPAKAR